MDENDLIRRLESIQEQLNNLCLSVATGQTETSATLISINKHLEQLNSKVDRNKRAIATLNDWKVEQIAVSAVKKEQEQSQISIIRERKETRIAIFSLIVVSIVNVLLHFI